MKLKIYTADTLYLNLSDGLQFRLLQGETGAGIVAIIKSETGVHTAPVTDKPLVKFLLPAMLEGGSTGGTNSILPPVTPPPPPPAAADQPVTTWLDEVGEPYDPYAFYSRQIDEAEKKGDFKELRRLQLEVIELADKQAPSQQEITLGIIPGLDGLEKTMTDWR